MLRVILRLLAMACIAPGLWHLALGAGGDWLLGIPAPIAIDPSLDSQNRFYGAVFIGFGAAMWWAADRIVERHMLIRLLLLAMLLGAVGRALAYATHGLPSAGIMLLWSSELALPALLWLWLNTNLRRSDHD